MITQKRLEKCRVCISPDEPHENTTEYGHEPHLETESSDINIFNGWLDDDHHEFMSDMCLDCTHGIVPSHLPKEQVIRFIKNIFKKKGIVI